MCGSKRINCVNAEPAPFFFARVVTLLALTTLLVTLVVGIGPNWSSRLMGIGGSIWEDYAKDLRTDPVKPDCVISEMEARLAECGPNEPTPKSDIPEDPFADPEPDEDPFADPKPDEDPFADPKPDEDPFADPKPDEDPFADPEPDEDPFADPKPEADPFAETTKTATPKRRVNCAALRALKDQCDTQHALQCAQCPNYAIG